MIGMIFLLHQTTAIFCPAFSCSSNPYTSLTGYCILQQGASYSLSICDDEYYSYCNASLTDTLCSLPPTTSDLNTSYIGEPCVYDRTCINSICINNTCTKSEVSQDCSYSSMCSPGYFCNSSDYTCTKLIPLNSEYPCTEDFDCIYSSGCHNGTCIPYFSLTGGTTIETCNSQTNLLCESASCQVESNTGVIICVNAINSSSTLPLACNGNQDCVINDNGFTYTTRCICGINAFAQSFCNLAPGDADFMTLVKLYKEWINSSNVTMCNTMRRISLPCIQTYASPSFFAKFNYYYLRVQNYPLLIKNDQCIMDIYNNEYYEALNVYLSYQESEESSSFAGVLVACIGLLSI